MLDWLSTICSVLLIDMEVEGSHECALIKMRDSSCGSGVVILAQTYRIRSVNGEWGGALNSGHRTMINHHSLRVVMRRWTAVEIDS